MSDEGDDDDDDSGDGGDVEFNDPLIDAYRNMQSMFDENPFNGYDAEQKSVVITHEGTAQITVPAGTFDTYKIKYSGGAPSQLFYVDQEQHKVVKIEVLKSPWEYQLKRYE